MRMSLLVALLWSAGCSEREALPPSEDAGRPDDAGQDASRDAGASDAGGTDAGRLDAGGAAVDACTRPACETPPPGCTWEGMTACSCGEMRCEPVGGACSPPTPFGGGCPWYAYCDSIACGSGSCVRRPAGCDAPDEPVCGCDGRTYPSACAAHAAGVDDSMPGECPPGVCTTDGDCPETFYCASCPTPFGERRSCLSDGTTCGGGPPEVPCTADSDCEAGQYCATCPTPFGDIHRCRPIGGDC